MLLQGFFQNVHAFIKVSLGLHLPVDGGNERRKLLPLLLFNVVLERLKERVVWILRQVGFAGGERLAEVSVAEMLLGLDIRGVHRVMFGADLVVKALVGGATLRSRSIGGAPVQFQDHRQLAECAADVSLLPRFHRRAVNLGLLLAQLVVFVLSAINLRNELQRSAFFRPELQHVLQSFTRVRIGVIIHVLARQPVPVLDLLLAAAVFYLALQRQCLSVVGLHLKYVLKLLQCQRILGLFEAGFGCFHQLCNRLAPYGSVERLSQGADRTVNMSFRFQFAENLPGKLVVSRFERFGGALQTRTRTRRIKELDLLVAQRFVEDLTELACACVTVPGLLRHTLVHHAPNGLAYRRIDLRSRRWDLFADGFDNLVCPGPLERLPAGERLVAHHTQRKYV